MYCMKCQRVDLESDDQVVEAFTTYRDAVNQLACCLMSDAVQVDDSRCHPWFPMTDQCCIRHSLTCSNWMFAVRYVGIRNDGMAQHCFT